MSNKMIGYAITYKTPEGREYVTGVCSGGGHEKIKMRARNEPSCFKVHRIFSQKSLSNWDKKFGKFL